MAALLEAHVVVMGMAIVHSAEEAAAALDRPKGKGPGHNSDQPHAKQGDKGLTLTLISPMPSKGIRAWP